jgi:hypothetical protein
MPRAAAMERLLAGCGLVVERLALSADAYLLVTAHGGRIFGPFVDGDDPIGWRPDAIAAAIAVGDWNIGGERVWLAPEAAFNFTDAARIIETYRVDPALDPGSWGIRRDGETLLLEMTADIQLADGSGRIGIAVSRTLAALRPRTLPGGVQAFGYIQRVETRQRSGPQLALVPWLIRQVAPVGTAFLDAKEGASGKAVFGAPPAAAIAPKDGWWQVPFHGPGFMKASYHRDAVRDGRLGLIAQGDAGAALLYRPALADGKRYPESLPGAPRSAGQFAALFYDDGRFGAYGEIELYGHCDLSARGFLEVEVSHLVGAVDAVLAGIGLAGKDPQTKTLLG